MRRAGALLGRIVPIDASAVAIPHVQEIRTMPPGSSSVEVHSEHDFLDGARR